MEQNRGQGLPAHQLGRLAASEGGGVQGDGQAEGAPGIDLLYIGRNSGWDNKIGVAGSRFLRGVAGKV